MNAVLLDPAPGFPGADDVEADDLLIRARADVTSDGSFGERWVVVDRTDVRVFDGGARPAVQQVPIAELVGCRSEACVGGGAMVLERADEAPLRIRYSQSEAAKFAEVVRGIEQLREGKAFHINGHIQRNRCSTCRRLLPERDGICPACIRKTATLARLAVRLWPHKLRTVTVALASLFVTAAALAPPLVTAMIVDDVLVPADPAPMEERLGLLALLVAGLVGIRVASWAAEWVHGWNATWLGARVTADIRAELYHRLELLSLSFYDKHPAGSLIARATRDVQMLQGFLIDGVPYLVTNLLTLVGILALMLGMSLHLSLYVLLPVPLILLWGAFYWSRLRILFTRLMQSWGRLTDRTVETLTGIRVVKAFAQEAREIGSFNVANGGIRAAGIRVTLHQGIFFATMALITALGMMLVWGVGGQQVLDNAITLGTLVAFYSYMWMFLGPIQWLGQMNDSMSRAFASAERIFEIIDAPPEGAIEGAVPKRPSLAGHVRLGNVTFGYDKSKPVLKGVELELKPGEMVGIVGRSGVGKTTIVNLIARFYDPDQGSVEIDGVDARELDPGHLRSHIGMVLQEPLLFSGTIADNIGYGKPGATLAEIMDAARAANAHNFIMAKPDGYETPVGEKGTGLSGGERQRISIARAILRDPRILIFDEATASVDVETERHIQVALERLMQGRTTIAIAHRLSTLRGASRIVVMEEGRIAEQGSHAELMAQRGTFHELVTMQQATSEIIAVAD